MVVRTDAWEILPADGRIEDPALALPLLLHDLVVAAKSDDAVARALLAKRNPILVAALAEARVEGRSQRAAPTPFLRRQGEEGVSRGSGNASSPAPTRAPTSHMRVSEENRTSSGPAPGSGLPSSSVEPCCTCTPTAHS